MNGMARRGEGSRHLFLTSWGVLIAVTVLLVGVSSHWGTQPLLDLGQVWVSVYVMQRGVRLLIAAYGDHTSHYLTEYTIGGILMLVSGVWIAVSLRSLIAVIIQYHG
jgi:hypothetical protein